MAVSESGAAADTELEDTIAAIWQEILEFDDFGWEDSFFDIGGDSMQLAIVRNRLVDEVPNLEIPLVAVYQHPSVRALAAYIRDQQW
ncbi:phosphopantetheine-binding protein [Kitasatospora griseola]|uniref:phosphopantetheine-binding protein n=1 Tax=Kitasatospora griseola TaxID=2064 RepID=UPI0034148191